jgi:hypothetical protein
VYKNAQILSCGENLLTKSQEFDEIHWEVSK